LEQGVFRVLEKPYQNDELANAVREAVKYDSARRREKRYRLDIEHRLESLDARERVTLEMIVAGSMNKAVEHRLGLSTRTVDRIRASILEKTKFQSFIELSAAYGAASKSGCRGLPRTSREVDCPATGEGDPKQAPFTENASDLQWLCCDLHDGAAQYLSAALMRVQVVEARRDIPEEVRTHLRETGAILAVALAEIRDIIAGKSPGLPQQSELVPAIKDFFLQLARPHGIEVEFVENLGDERIPSLPGMAAYRILQECVNNAVRHSGSKRLRLELIRESDTLRLEFRDWGCGFEPDAVAADHRGLRSIHHRAELLGGRATIHSEPQKGTVVTVNLPLGLP
jgi:two-component sensor histidine kinase/DNA-binding CsgD family transcriptional regulator